MKTKVLLITFIIALACSYYWMVQDYVRIEREVYCGVCHPRVINVSLERHTGEMNMGHKEDIIKGFEDLKKDADSLPTKSERDKGYKIIAETMRDTSNGKMRMHIFQRDNVKTGE